GLPVQAEEVKRRDAPAPVVIYLEDILGAVLCAVEAHVALFAVEVRQRDLGGVRVVKTRRLLLVEVREDPPSRDRRRLDRLDPAALKAAHVLRPFRSQPRTRARPVSDATFLSVIGVAFPPPNPRSRSRIPSVGSAKLRLSPPSTRNVMMPTSRPRSSNRPPP